MHDKLTRSLCSSPFCESPPAAEFVSLRFSDCSSRAASFRSSESSADDRVLGPGGGAPPLPPQVSAVEDSSLHLQHLLVQVGRLHVQQEGEELQQPHPRPGQRRLHLQVMTPALPVEKENMSGPEE